MLSDTRSAKTHKTPETNKNTSVKTATKKRRLFVRCEGRRAKSNSDRVTFLFFLILFFSIVPFTASQQFFVRNYTVRDGIENAYVNSVCQDWAGNMWFSTASGISVYNGNYWINYGMQNGLATNNYSHLFVANTGSIWGLPANCDFPIAIYTNGVWSELAPPQQPNSSGFYYQSIANITLSNKKTVAIGTSKGLFLYADKQWQLLLKGISIYTCTQSGKDIFVGTDEGLFVLKQDKSISKITDFSDSKVYSVSSFRDSKGKTHVYYFDQSTLGEIDGDHRKIISSGFELLSAPVAMKYYMTIDRTGNIYFGNSFTSFWFTPDKNILQPLSMKSGFSTNGSTDMYIDRENNLWRTGTRGIDKVTDLRILKYDSKDGLLEDEVTAIIEPQKGTLIYGQNYGYSKIENGKITAYRFPESIRNRYVFSRILDIESYGPDKFLFASSKAGLGECNIKTGKITWLYRTDYEYINSVVKDNTNTVWFLGTIGLYKMEGSSISKIFSRSQNMDFSRKIFVFPSDPALYLTGTEGILKIDNGNYHRLLDNHTSIEPNTSALVKLGDNHFLFGINKGLYEYENGNSKLYKSGNVTIQEPVYALKYDLKNRLWIGTQNGVLILDKTGRLLRINTFNGLAGDEVNRDALFLDSYGNMHVGTNKGVSIFSAAFELEEPPTPKVILETCETSGGEVYDLATDISLYNQNTIICKFHAVSFVNENGMLYQVKLAGLENNWQEIANNRLFHPTYKNLPPGKYQLLVRVKNMNGQWSEVVRSGSITVIGPFYTSWWFFLLMLFTFTGSGYYGYKYRIRRDLLLKLEFIVKQRTKELIDSQDELKKINEELEQRVMQRTSELEEANKKLLSEIKIKEQITKNLEESRESLSKAQAIANMGSWEFNIAAKTLNWSEQVMTIFEKDVCRSNKIESFIANNFHKTEQERLWKLLDKIQETRLIQSLELLYTVKNGTVKYLLIEGAPKIDPVTGVITGIVGIVQDITERKNTALVLESMNKELQQNNINKDKFFTIIAHDLRSPFQSLLGYTQLLHDQFEEFTDAERKAFSLSIRDTSKRLYGLLEDLLSWSRLQMGNYQPVFSEIELMALVSEVIYIHKSAALQKSITINNAIPVDLVIFADESMMKTVFRNLISNAIKFSHMEGDIQIAAYQEKESAVITIQDFGIGMSQEKLHSVFEIDKVESVQGTAGEKGSGLGLIITREMIHKNHGVFEIESEVGKGTTVRFTLPLKSH